MSYSFPVMGRCRVTVTISVNKLLLRRKFEANPLVNREMMLGRPIASAKQPRTASTQLYDRTQLAVGIAQALGILEGQATEEHLLRFFRQFLNNGIHNSRRGARRNRASRAP